jgi:hypothetical protein
MPSFWRMYKVAGSTRYALRAALVSTAPMVPFSALRA